MGRDEQPEYIKPRDFAKNLGVTRGAVYKWIKEGKLRAVRFGDNAVRIPRAEAEAFERRAADQDSADDVQLRALGHAPASVTT